MIVTFAHKDTETLLQPRTKTLWFQWHFTTMMWTVWLSMETRTWPTFHTPGSLDSREAAKSWPRATPEPPSLLEPPQQHTHMLGPYQPQGSRSACASHGRQEPPTLTNDTYPHNLALQPRGWLPSLHYPFSPSKYSHEFFLVSTPWYYIPKFFLLPLLSQYLPFFNSLLAQPSQ